MNSITVAVQSPSCVRLFATQQTAALQAFMTLIISRSLSKFISILLVMPSSHLILWCPLLLLPSIFPNSRDFSNESSVCIRWPKYWSLSFSISLSIEFSSVQFSRSVVSSSLRPHKSHHAGLISIKIDWLDLLAVQRTLKSLLQHHSSKASILRHSAFFMVQLSQPYVTTRKTIALTIGSFVGRVMSLLFNTLSRFVIAFLPRSKCLLISWLLSRWF